MANKLQIYNGALLTHLDTRPLVTLTDARTERRALDAAWPEALQWMLEQGMWNFAARTQSWEPATTPVPGFGQRYAYAKPEDYVRLIRIADNETLEPTLADFLEEGEFFLSYASILYVQFVSNDLSWGADLSKWGASFATAFEAELAYRAQGGVKTLSTIDKDALGKTKRRLLKNAQSKDVVNQAPAELPTGRLVRARGGFGRSNNMRRTPYG